MSIDYSLIIPAYNEEDYLPATLESAKLAMEKLDYKGELIVVDNNSSDRTPDIAREHGAKVVFEPINQIARSRNAGAKSAKGRFLIFLDADTHMPPDLLREAVENLKSGECCGGGSLADFEGKLQESMNWLINFWNWLAKKFSLAAGAFVYCLKEAFDDIGGFDERVYASEEIWFSIKLRRWGKKNNKRFRLITNSPFVSSSRKLEWYSAPHLLGMMFLILLCPWFVRSRLMCYLWYKRPKN